MKLYFKYLSTEFDLLTSVFDRNRGIKAIPREVEKKHKPRTVVVKAGPGCAPSIANPLYKWGKHVIAGNS